MWKVDVNLVDRGLCPEPFRDAFSHLEIEDWSTIGNRNGYDSAEFNTKIAGLPSSSAYPAGYDSLRIYRTEAGAGASYYLVSQVAKGTSSLTDAT